jgi:YggT family protein
MTFAIISAINLLFTVLTIVILIDVLASWIMIGNVRLPDALYRLLEVVHNIAGVVLNPIRRFIPSMGGLDISPIIALILLQVLQTLLVRVLRGY